MGDGNNGGNKGPATDGNNGGNKGPARALSFRNSRTGVQYSVGELSVTMQRRVVEVVTADGTLTFGYDAAKAAGFDDAADALGTAIHAMHERRRVMATPLA